MTEAVESSDLITCTECGEEFRSKNRLFIHLETHGVERESVHATRPGKIVLLVGWLSESHDDDEWAIDGHINPTWKNTTDRIESELFKAIEMVDGPGDDSRDTDDVKGFSRASGCAQRASHMLQSEASCHGGCDVLCFQLKKKSKPKNQTWVEAVNSKLPADIHVMEVYNLPQACCDLHAESLCSQRRYEYVLPLQALFPPDEPIADIPLRIGGIKTEPNRERSWCVMDNAFPRNTPSGKARIENFRKLKVILKKFGGKKCMHNMMTGGGSPDDAPCKRRVDRFYHKELLLVDGTVPNLSISSVVTDSSGTSEEWAVFSISGNAFLKGQARKMVGLAISVLRGWLPMSFMDVAMDDARVVKVPSAPGCGLYLAECQFAKWETKHGFYIDPRRIEGADSSRIEDWIRIVQHRAIQQMKERDWMASMKEQCQMCLLQYETEQSLLNRTPESLRTSLRSCRTGIPATCSIEVRGAYERVLNLLRAADSSGSWPASSQARQKVITESSLVEKGSRGGTFSVGFLPAPLSQPKGNELFPELLLACFQLEKILYPSRTPSSTIAVNRHAQFRPHRDTGAGSGQTTSLIVALGDFAGGELMVECKANDIRYSPVEMDGWGQRHWTLPFEGERYSLVWFTPLGVKVPDDLWWLKDI